MRTASVWLLFLSSLIAGCGTAGERYQDATIRYLDGELCFSIGDSREARKLRPALSGVRLYERVSGMAVNIWESNYQGRDEDVRLSPNDCLPYSGGSPDPAPPLSQGKAYSVTIRADVRLDTRFTARWYSGYFCMVETENGLLPYQVEAGGQVGTPAWEACGPGVRW